MVRISENTPKSLDKNYKTANSEKVSLTKFEITSYYSEIHPKFDKRISWNAKAQSDKKVETKKTTESWITEDSAIISSFMRKQGENLGRKEGFYRDFVLNIAQLMSSAIWWDKPGQDLWIYKVEATLPQGKWKDTSENLQKWEINSSKTPEFQEDDKTKQVSKIQIRLDSEAVAKLNSDSEKLLGGPLSLKLTRELTKMSKLFCLFFSPDWTSVWLELTANRSDSYNFSGPSMIKAQMFLTRERLGNLTQHVLTFVRVYEGRFYKCSVYFQGEEFSTQIRNYHIWYKDRLWNQGGYYSANGAYSATRNHIGGVKNTVKKNGHTWTEIDSQLSSMWKDFETQPWNAWKWLMILSNISRNPEVAKTFWADSYITIAQKSIPISRSDSYIWDVYKKLHPLSEAFYAISEMPREKVIEVQKSMTSLMGIEKYRRKGDYRVPHSKPS